MNLFRVQLALSVLLTLFLMNLPGAIAQSKDLGEIDFPTSGSTGAQASFVRGVLLLHSFEYKDAAAAFREAQKLDPDFVMAYWGEAMTHNHPIWNQRDQEGALAVLRRLGASAKERAAKAPTEREKDYLNTLEVLYADGDKLGRDQAYSAALKSLYEKYPKDLEAASFYALSILGTAQGVRDFRTYMRAAAIVEDVFQENSRHPGAAHYLIHSFDDPIHAPLGLKAARAYADIAPEAPHALHMPSHIFMALGMWDESASSNEASEAAAIKKGQSGLHATWWLHYSYLQQGRYTEASDLIKRTHARLGPNPNESGRRHLAYMHAAHLIETLGRAPVDGVKAPDIDSVPVKPAVSLLLARGLLALEKKDHSKAERLLGLMQDRLSADRSEKKDSAWLSLVEQELRAAIGFSTGDTDAALASMQKAAHLQEGLTFEFGPAFPVKPVHELLGEMFLRQRRFAEAQVAFRGSLDRNANRALSLLGLARALAGAGDLPGSRAVYEQLGRIWHRADTNIVELEEVRANTSEFGSN